MEPPPHHDSTVEPSPPLIATLHERLRDPSIVPQFEARRQIKASFCHLIRPRWVLCRAGEQQNIIPGADHDSGRDADASSARVKKFTEINAIPHRNYIDLRMEQNKMFADERLKQFNELISLWKTGNNGADRGSKARGSTAEEKRRKQWEMIRSCIKEGLAAYPGHEGLLLAQKEMNEFHSSRLGGEEVLSHMGKSSAVDGANGRPSVVHESSQKIITRLSPAAIAAPNGNLLKEQTYLEQPLKKGAAGRAQAAMRDALLERSFLDEGAATTSDATGKYQLLPEVHSKEKLLDNPNNQTADHRNEDSSSSNNSRIGSDEGSRSLRRHRRPKHKKEHKRNKKRRKHHKHEKKKRRRHEDGHRHHSGKRSRSSSLPRR